jgi:excisionase family DNA binding protein
MQTMLTVKEVANELGYNPEVIRKLIRSGAIPCIRLHKQRLRIKKSWLDKMLSEDTEAQFNQAKEDKILGIPETKPVEIVTNNNKEVIDMTNKKTEITEITTTKPKVKEFIPNPKKRITKARIITQPEDEPYIEDEPEDEDEINLDEYKGIGNYD